MPVPARRPGDDGRCRPGVDPVRGDRTSGASSGDLRRDGRLRRGVRLGVRVDGVRVDDRPDRQVESDSRSDVAMARPVDSGRSTGTACPVTARTGRPMWCRAGPDDVDVGVPVGRVHDDLHPRPRLRRVADVAAPPCASTGYVGGSPDGSDTRLVKRAERNRRFSSSRRSNPTEAPLQRARSGADCHWACGAATQRVGPASSVRSGMVIAEFAAHGDLETGHRFDRRCRARAASAPSRPAVRWTSCRRCGLVASDAWFVHEDPAGRPDRRVRWASAREPRHAQRRTASCSVAEGVGQAFVLDEGECCRSADRLGDLRLGPPQWSGRSSDRLRGCSFRMPGLLVASRHRSRATFVPTGDDPIEFAVRGRRGNPASTLSRDAWPSRPMDRSGRCPTVTSCARSPESPYPESARASPTPHCHSSATRRCSSIVPGDRVRRGDGDWQQLPEDVDGARVVLQQPGSPGRLRLGRLGRCPLVRRS